MKKRFTILIAALMLLTMISQPTRLLGQVTTDAYKQTTFNSDNNNTSVSGYSNSWSNTTSGFTVDITNANNNSNGWNYIKIGSSSSASTGKITTNAVIDKPVYSVTINIGAITSTYVTSITLYTKTTSGSWSSAGTFAKSAGEKTVTIESPTENLYYKIEAVCTKAKSNGPLQINWVKFNVETHTVTYDCDGGTSGPTSPVSAFIGSYTIASTTPSRDGYSFQGWNDGISTYAAAYTITTDVTFTAQWQSLSSPNIVINDGTPIVLAKGASGAQTATVAYNNMSGYSSPSVALFNDSGCTEEFTGGWFSASLSDEGSTTLNYSASANTIGERTVYIKVSATYDEETISSILAATQATSTRTVTYNANGGTGTTTDSNSPYNYGATVNAVDNAFTAPDGKYFTNWSTTTSGPGDSYDEGDEITDNITSDIVLYARWADLPTYTRITSLTELVPGEHYIIVGSTNSGAWAMGKQTGSNTYRDADVVTVQTEDTDDDEVIDRYYVEASGLQEFVISGPTSSSPYLFTIYDESQKTDHYINANGGTSSNTINVTSTIANTSQFTISFSTKAIITANFSGKNTLSFNSSANPKRFSFYGAEQTALYLYKKDTKVGDPVNLNIYSATTLNNDNTIEGQMIVSGDMTIHVGVFAIPSEKTLKVTGDLTNGTAANLIIEDGGQLITSSTGVKATIEKDIAQATNGEITNWYLISSPVGTVSTDVVEENDINLYAYNEANLAWNGYLGSNGFENLVSGKGYLYRNSEDVTLSFTGTVATPGTVAGISLTCDNEDDDFAGFNLLGNPYSQKISSSCISLSNGATFTGVYTLGTDGGWYSSVSADINPCEGFLVKVDKATTATFGTPAKGTTYNNDYIQFTVANSQYEDVTYALFSKGNGLTKINHRNANIPMLYINQNDKDYAIANFSDNTKLFNLNFKAMTTGKYTLSYNTTGEYNYLHVIDRLTGADVDMLLEGEYSFIATPSDNTNRFVVRLEYMPNYNEGNDEIFAFQNGNEVLVNGSGELQIFDVTGRSVMTTTINGAESINLSVSGVYIFRLIGTEVKTQKIVVR